VPTLPGGSRSHRHDRASLSAACADGRERTLLAAVPDGSTRGTVKVCDGAAGTLDGEGAAGRGDEDR
jgi:hypothetical protein